jgi:formylglycine-generating enzyme required for sulfatase activity
VLHDDSKGALCFGIDSRFGVYADLTIATTHGVATQRLRWIPPGRFMMGSPEGEEGRRSAEGPQHEVTLAEGVWLFDTPCTQALWQAVMGGNPSRFKSPTRPVEQVSFEDVQGFLDKVNALVPGLDLGLPSEAQWEYACLGGTETATYAGDMRIAGECNAPVLDAIAWYGGNSGVGFELDNGYDSSEWKEKQYEHTRAGTRPVAQKAANPWGLYDMLGNVWEWCDDRWHDSYRGAPTEGSAWIDPGGAASRVVRGGSGVVVRRRAIRACRVPLRLRPGVPL